MVFSSSTFVFLFLPIVLCLYYLIERFLPAMRNLFLFFISLLFYGFGEPKFILLLISSIIVNWGGALLIEKMYNELCRKISLIIDVVLNVSLLVIFKYMNFITLNVHRVFSNIETSDIALPIGISFFTFQAMSYVIDVYRGEEAQLNPINLGLYISFFPQLIAGPIVRYSRIAKEINVRQTKRNDFSEGVTGFLRGLFKKVIFANNMAIVADAAFSGIPNEQSVLFSWL